MCICTLRAVICIPSGSALGNTYNSTQGTNAIHTRNQWYNNYVTNELGVERICFPIIDRGGREDLNVKVHFIIKIILTLI